MNKAWCLFLALLGVFFIGTRPAMAQELDMMVEFRRDPVAIHCVQQDTCPGASPRKTVDQCFMEFKKRWDANSVFRISLPVSEADMSCKRNPVVDALNETIGNTLVRNREIDAERQAALQACTDADRAPGVNPEPMPLNPDVRPGNVKDLEARSVALQRIMSWLMRDRDRLKAACVRPEPVIRASAKVTAPDLETPGTAALGRILSTSPMAATFVDVKKPVVSLTVPKLSLTDPPKAKPTTMHAAQDVVVPTDVCHPETFEFRKQTDTELQLYVRRGASLYELKRSCWAHDFETDDFVVAMSNSAEKTIPTYFDDHGKQVFDPVRIARHYDAPPGDEPNVEFLKAHRGDTLRVGLQGGQVLRFLKKGTFNAEDGSLKSVEVAPVQAPTATSNVVASVAVSQGAPTVSPVANVSSSASAQASPAVPTMLGPIADPSADNDAGLTETDDADTSADTPTALPREPPDAGEAD